MNVNQDSLKKVNADPIANFFELVNKVQFIINLPPTLKKDARRVQVENYHRHLFGKGTNGAMIKNEMVKLQNGSREVVLFGGSPSQSFKDVSFCRFICLVDI